MEIYSKETDQIKSILKANPRGLSVTDISRQIGINRNTVAKYLEILRISGHIEMEYVGTAKIYFLSQRIPVSTLLDFSSDYIIVIDSKLKVVQVNDKFSDMTGLSKQEIKGKNISGILPPMISNKTLMDKINESLHGKELTEMLDIIINSELWFLKSKMVPSTFDDGEPGVTIIMENITDEIQSQNSLKLEQEKLEKMVLQRTAELKTANDMLKTEIAEKNRIEEKLHEEHEMMQKYLDIAGVLLAVTDNKGNIKLINRKGTEILECDSQKAIGANLIDTFVIKEERENTRKICEGIMEEESEVNCEKHITTPGGKKKLIRWNNVSFKDKNGNIVGVVISGEDITEQRRIEREMKEKEKKYRLLADNIPEGIWQVNMDLIITYVNPGALNIVDLDYENVIGTSVSEHVTENEAGRIRKIAYDFENDQNKENILFKTKVYDKNKILMPVEINSRKIFDSKGNLCGFQGTAKKVTESGTSGK